MTIPLFFSASTKAVQKAAQTAYPGEMVVVDEQTLDGRKTVAVTAVDYAMSAPETASWCVELYALASRVSSLPVSVFVQGGEGNTCTKDCETELVERRLGATIVAAAHSAYPGATPDWAKLVVIEFPDATPEQKRLDQRAIMALEHGPAGMVAFDLMNPTPEPGSDSDS